MKFFLPDSQDLVDPTFDFERERRQLQRLGLKTRTESPPSVQPAPRQKVRARG